MKKFDPRKLIGTILGLLMFSACVTFFTFAYYSWQSTNTNVVFTINDGVAGKVCELGPNVNIENIGPVLDYNDGVEANFQVKNNGTEQTTFSLSLNIISISDSLLVNSFKYILLKENSEGTLYEETGINGDFSDFQIGSNVISTSIPVEAAANNTYKLIVYIDGAMYNSLDMMEGSMNANLSLGDCDSVEGGIEYIPVVLKENEDTANPTILYYIEGDGFYTDNSFTNKITKLSTLPTRTGYTFNGYGDFIDSEGNIIGDSDFDEEGVTISANWIANNYQLLFVGNGGNIINGKTLNNLITDGGFEQTTSGWNLSNAEIVTTKSYSGTKSLKFSSGVTSMSRQTLSQSAPTLNNLYYGRTRFLSESGFSTPDARFEWFYSDSDYGKLTLFQKTRVTNGRWDTLSEIKSLTDSTYLSNSWGIRNFVVNSTTDSYVDEVMLLDLTTDFGAGQEFNNKDLLDKIPFFETTTSILERDIDYDEAYGELPIASKEGTIFAGWYSDESDGTKITDTTLFQGDSDKVLYAHYGSINMEAKKISTLTSVASNSWSSEGLNFIFNIVGEDDFNIYYCQDTNNTCEPTILASNGQEVTTYNNLEGIYYIRYKIENASGVSSEIYSYTAKVDLSTPVLLMSSGSYELTNTNNVYSVAFGSSSGTVNCYNTTRNDASVTTYASIGTLGSNTVTCTAISGAGKTSTESATFSVNWTVPFDSIKVTGTAYKSGTNVIVPNGGTQFGPYIPTNQGCYHVVYTGSNLNKYYNGYQAYSDGTTFEMTRLNYVDTDANYFIKVPSNVDHLETVFVNNGSSDITVSSIRITHQGDVNSCPSAYTYSINLNNQGATSVGTQSVTAAYLGSLPDITIPEKSYTVSYNGNGGSVITSSTASYTFNGYYSEVNGGGTQYYGSTGTGVRTYNVNGDSTLYASWTATSTNLPTPTRSGYSFLGWYDSNGNYIGAAGASYTPTSNITLVASWIEAVWYINSTGTYQNTLANAINAASSTDTLTLQKDKEDNTGSILKNITINTNGKTWTRNAVLNIDSSVTFNLTGSGTIKSTNNNVLITNYGTATINHTGNMTTGDVGIYNLGTMTITTANVSSTATTARPTILNTGQIKIGGGTYSSIGGNCVQNGLTNNPIGLAWISGGKFITTGTGTSVIRNFSDEVWPTASTTGKISYCTKSCSVHITGTTKISNTGSYWGVSNAAVNSTGVIHFPSSYTGYVHAKNSYVLKATQGNIFIYGGTIYAESGLDFSNLGDNTVTYNSNVKFDVIGIPPD